MSHIWPTEIRCLATKSISLFISDINSRLKFKSKIDLKPKNCWSLSSCFCKIVCVKVFWLCTVSLLNLHQLNKHESDSQAAWSNWQYALLMWSPGDELRFCDYVLAFLLPGTLCVKPDIFPKCKPSVWSPATECSWHCSVLVNFLGPLQLS